MTPVILPISWEDFERAVTKLVARTSDAFISGVYGVPRGGATVAVRVASLLKVPVLDTPVPGCLIVDDLVDSGATLDRYLSVGPVDALFRKPYSPAHLAPEAETMNGWIVFPWESHEPTGPVDAVVRLLQYIGEDPKREGLRDTPARVLKAWTETTCGYNQDPAEILHTTFDVQADEMVVLRNVQFYSTCEHHMLPFYGTVTVGYLPQDRVVGISKLARLVQCFARRLQVQERMTSQIAEAVMTNLHPLGVGVVVRGHHLCMGLRGVQKPEAVMVTSSLLGRMREPAVRSEFLSFTD